jgi:tetratricopeptide (TPR) repeat protein
MPYRLNGCGTWYYGKQDVFEHEGTCPHCGQDVVFTSFSTRKWLTFLFVPVIPIKRLRIINECPACTRHQAVGLRAYEASRENLYKEVQQKTAQNPKDPQAAIEQLQAYSQFQDWPALQRQIPLTAAGFPNDPQVLSAIGYVYYYFGHLDRAADYLSQSLAIREDPEIHESLGFLFLRKSDPDAAAEHFRFILEGRVRDKAPVLLTLAENYQHLGRHKEALAVLDGAAELDPDLQKQKPYIKLRKLSEKNLHTGKPVKGLSVIQKGGPFYSAGNPRLAWAIGGLVVLGLFGWYLFEALKRGRNPEVYLVGGLSKVYPVQIDQQSFSVPAMDALKIRLAEGTYALSVPDGGPAIAPQTIRLRSSFWLRPFRKRLYVINPDAVAPLIWTKSFYGPDIAKLPEGISQLHIGEVLYTFTGIDFPFAPFPSQVKMSGSRPEPRYRLSLLIPEVVDKTQLGGVVESFLGQETAVSVLTRHLALEPEESWYLYDLAGRMEWRKFVEVIRPGLDALPVRIDWHRMYQESVEENQPDYDLAAEYRGRLEKQPDDAALQYLMGRVLHDPQESAGWYQKSAGGPAPCPYGYFALAYHALAMAEFEKALGYYEKAYSIDPANVNFGTMWYSMLIAAGHYDRALEYCRRRQSDSISGAAWIYEESRICLLQGDLQKARSVRDQWLARTGKKLSAEWAEQTRQAFDKAEAYFLGDFERYRQLADPQDPAEQLAVFVHFAQPVPDTCLDQIESADSVTYLIAAMSEDRIGNTEHARALMTRAIEKLRKEGWEQTQFADWLEGSRPIEDPQRVCGLLLEANQKAVLLTALGRKVPAHRDLFYGLADRLNYQREFPYHFLKTIHQEHRQKQ